VTSVYSFSDILRNKTMIGNKSGHACRSCSNTDVCCA